MSEVYLELAHQPHAPGGGVDHLAVHARRAASGIDLRDLSNAQNHVRITPQQELLKVADLLPLLLLRCAEDPLPQVRHLTIRLNPVDAGPSFFEARCSG